MSSFGKKKSASSSYMVPVPQNSNSTLDHITPGMRQQMANLKENHFERNDMHNCPHCENMAKNFLYLESLIRNNYDKENKCSLCQSSLKYLQYVNRNILQVFGNFDAIVQAARIFASQSPPVPKYAVKQPQPKPLRSKGGALITPQKSVLKSQKSKKSLKSIKSTKSGKSLSKSTKSLTKTKSKGKAKLKSKSKNRISHGKIVLKNKFKSKSSSGRLAKQLSTVVRSASQYQHLHSVKSKVAKKSKKIKQRGAPLPVSINWNLLKKNMPKRNPILV